MPRQAKANFMAKKKLENTDLNHINNNKGSIAGRKSPRLIEGKKSPREIRQTGGGLTDR